MKFSELNGPGQTAAVDQIQRHTETLRALLISGGDRAEHYLLWTNGGAAIALLSFMAASERIRNLPAAWHALMCFVAGIVSCGLLAAVNYHFRLTTFRRWNIDTEKFLADALDHEVLYGNLKRLARGPWAWLPPALGYIAFASFITGAIIALKHFAPLAGGDPSGGGPG